MSPDETIEQWAKRTAPLLHSDGWAALRNGTPWQETRDRMLIVNHAGLPTVRGEALLAYRDKVAAELAEYERTVLLSEVYGPPAPWGARRSAAGVLQRLQLMCLGSGASNFGREIARVLRGDR